MLVKCQTGVAKVHHSTIDRYIELGYRVEKDQKELIVKAEHLPKSSPIVLDFACDECGEIYQKKRSSQHKLKRDLCEKCRVVQANNSFNKNEKVIKIFAKTEFECHEKVMRERKKGYKRSMPIVKGEGVIDKYSGQVETYYYTIMKLAE